jgi:hypothetical protein
VGSKSEQVEEDEMRTGFYSQPGPSTQLAKGADGGVGKYMTAGLEATTLPKLTQEAAATGAAARAPETLTAVPQEKKKQLPQKTVFRDFSGW